MNSLLIIGNGYDLYCGLNSRYSDFFKNRVDLEFLQTIHNYYYFQRDDESIKGNLKYFDSKYYFKGISFDKGIRHFVENAYGKDLSDIHYSLGKNRFFLPENLTFWDIVFYYSKSLHEYEWHDIESRLSDFLLPNREITNINIEQSFSDIKHFNDSLLCSAVFFSFFQEKRWKPYSDSTDFLKAELTILEKEFSSYLKKQLENNQDYFYRSKELITRLLNPISHNSLDKINIINFNYTNPFSEKKNSHPNLSNGVNGVVNVHGSLEQNNIIFGIDSNSIAIYERAYFFTKTYRLLVGSYSSNPVQNTMINSKELDRIIFFGHSLSKLDYSYFQSIFDYYCIYDSHVKLIFYFNRFDNRSSQHHKEEMSKKVINLISSYSKTLDNEDHGKNLLHKLLIEQRLFISEIP